MMPTPLKVVAEIPDYLTGETRPGLTKLSSSEIPFEPIPGVPDQAVSALRTMGLASLQHLAPPKLRRRRMLRRHASRAVPLAVPPSVPSCHVVIGNV